MPHFNQPDSLTTLPPLSNTTQFPEVVKPSSKRHRRPPQHPQTTKTPSFAAPPTQKHFTPEEIISLLKQQPQSDTNATTADDPNLQMTFFRTNSHQYDSHVRVSFGDSKNYTPQQTMKSQLS